MPTTPDFAPIVFITPSAKRVDGFVSGDSFAHESEEATHDAVDGSEDGCSVGGTKNHHEDD